jgi:hypothetical protein
MWVAFSHIVIFGLVIFGFMLAKDGHPQKEAMLVSIAVGVIVLVIYAGPWAILSATASALIGYGFSRGA